VLVPIERGNQGVPLARDGWPGRKVSSVDGRSGHRGDAGRGGV